MATNKLKRAFLTFTAAAMAIILSGCFSNEGADRFMKIDSFNGQVSVDRGEKLEASEELQLLSEDIIEVGDGSSLEILIDGDKHISAEGNTGFAIFSEGDKESDNITVELMYGIALFSIDEKPEAYSNIDVNTPNASLSMRGTSFLAAYEPADGTTSVEALEGKVRISYDGNITFLEDGESASIITTGSKTELVMNSGSGNNMGNGDSDSTKPFDTTANTGEENITPEESSTSEAIKVEEAIFTITMTYPENGRRSAVNADYKTEVSGFAMAKAGLKNDDILFQKYIGIIKRNSEIVDKFYDMNKDNAADSSSAQKKITGWFREPLISGDKVVLVNKASMSITPDASGIVFEFFGDFRKNNATTTVPPVYSDDETASEPDDEDTPEVTDSPVVTAPPSTTKTTTAKTTEKTTTTKKESSIGDNAIKLQEIVSGRIVYLNIPSGYKLWEYDASDYKKDGKLYGALLVPKKSGKYNISVTFGSGDPMKTLVKSGKADKDRSSYYKVIDKYKCVINKSKTGTAYIAELIGSGGKSEGYMIFVQCVSGENVYLVVELEDEDGNILPITTSHLYGSTKDIKKLAREMFPAD